MARESLEIVENIRDTNWIKLSSDYRACYDVLNYDINCIGSATGVVNTVDRMYNGSYLPTVRSNGAWTLTPVASPSTIRGTYASQFPIFLDNN